MGAMTLVDFLDERIFVVVYSFMIVQSLVIVCVSYLTIRKHLKKRGRDIDIAHNRQSMKNITKRSTTMFVVIATSIVHWIPGLVLYCVSYWYHGTFSEVLLHILSMLFATNSLVNLIIYIFRMQIFRKTLKRLKRKLGCRRHSKQYTLHHYT